MMDVNLMIANNILAIMKTQGKKQVELADGIGVSRATVSKMLNGSRSINAIEMKKIAEFLNSSMDAIHAFMGKVETEEAREALKVADKVSDLIVFHSRVRKNGMNMMNPVEE